MKDFEEVTSNNSLVHLKLQMPSLGQLLKGAKPQPAPILASKSKIDKFKIFERQQMLQSMEFRRK
jgi:hypothetical protein